MAESATTESATEGSATESSASTEPPVSIEDKEDPSASMLAGTIIPLSAESKEYRDAMVTMSGAPKLTVQGTPRARQWLAQPDRYDPLSFAVTDQLFALAQSRRQPLVAVVSDDEATSLSLTIAQDRSLEALSEEIKNPEDWTLVPDDRWLLLKPADPDQARQRRVPRAALRELLQANPMTGSADRLARFAQAVPARMNHQLVSAYLISASVEGLDLLSVVDLNLELYRFYGALLPGSRQVLRQGGVVRVGELTPDGRNSLSRMVFGSPGLMSLIPQEPTGPALDPFTRRLMSGIQGSVPLSLAEEPTEILAQGLSPQGEIRMTVTPGYLFRAVASQGEVSPMYRSLGMTELALFGMMRDVPEAANDLPNFDRVRVGKSEDLAIRILVTPKHHVELEFSNHLGFQDPAVYSLSALPPEVQKKYTAVMDQFKKSPFGMMGGLDRGGAVPTERP